MCFNMEGIIKITPNKEKARSILKMVEVSLERIQLTNLNKFVSNIVKDYYDVIRELISVILLLDGFKVIGEEAHKKLIEYFSENYHYLEHSEIIMVDELRVLRNKITYDGFFVRQDFLERNFNTINNIINKLKLAINNKLKSK